MRKGLSLVVVLSVIVGTLVLASVAFAQATPSVTVRDQAVAGGSVTVERVVAAQNGWIVIHIDNNGAPGAVIGQAAVRAGENTNVSVPITVAQATPRLYAMLHIDAGTAGTYEFPGADVPVSPMIAPAFSVSGLGGAAQATATRTATAAATTAAATTAAPTVMATRTAAPTMAAAATATRTAAVMATRTASPATLPTTGGGSALVIALLGLGGLSLFGGVALNFLRRNAR
jgi:hypothetical protein